MILALAPHTDDVCLGAGGYVALAAERGEGVLILAFGLGNPESGAHSGEFATAARKLGPIATECLGYPCRAYHEYRQDILSDIEHYITKTGADTLLIPGRDDHQDHRTVREEACRVTRSRHVNVVSYEQAWNHAMCPFNPTLFVPLEFRHLAAKCEAIKAFKSQRTRPYARPDYAIANATRWAVYVEARYAEAFEVIKWTI